MFCEPSLVAPRFSGPSPSVLAQPVLKGLRLQWAESREPCLIQLLMMVLGSRAIDWQQRERRAYPLAILKEEESLSPRSIQGGEESLSPRNIEGGELSLSPRNLEGGEESLSPG
eukprot:2960225-Amphidinium_carterae.1